MKKINSGRKYCIFLDIDGTIAPYGDQIHPINLKVVQKLRDLGHKVFLVTGRSWKGAEIVYQRLKLDTPVIVFTGALTYHPLNDGFPIREYRIKGDKVREIATDEYLVANSDAIMINNEDDVYMNKLDETLFYDCHVNYANKVIIGDINRYFHHNGAHSIVIGTKKHIAKSKYNKCLSKYNNLIWREWLSYRQTSVISISVELASKSFGIKNILEFYKWDKENTIAFGDGSNDIDMIEFVKYGIKMKNGSSSLDKVKWDETKYICSAAGVGLYLNSLFNLNI